jgi:hypothetical protein
MESQKVTREASHPDESRDPEARVGVPREASHPDESRDPGARAGAPRKGRSSPHPNPLLGEKRGRPIHWMEEVRGGPKP